MTLLNSNMSIISIFDLTAILNQSIWPTQMKLFLSRKLNPTHEK